MPYQPSFVNFLPHFLDPSVCPITMTKFCRNRFVLLVQGAKHAPHGWSIHTHMSMSSVFVLKDDTFFYALHCCYVSVTFPLADIFWLVVHGARNVYVPIHQLMLPIDGSTRTDLKSSATCFSAFFVFLPFPSVFHNHLPLFTQTD